MGVIFKVRITLIALVLLSIPFTVFAQSELFISEYIEGSSNNKAIEIYNGTGTSVDLDAGVYTLEMYFNGNTSAGLTISLSGVVANGDVFVIAQSSADPAIIAEADQQNGSGWFNGDDAVVLKKAGVVIDAIGQAGFDPGSQWGSGDISTQDNTLRRKSSILTGDTDETDVFDPSLEWDGYPNNTFDGLGSHTIDTGGPATFVFINEVDSDTPGTDALEFVEIYDGGVGNTPLDSLVVVFYNGSDDASYDAFDLDGYSTDANGFFLMGNSGVSPTPSIIFAGNGLQNGADAVAIHVGDAADYPNDTPVSTANLVDALVYDTNDGDDAGLLVLLNSGQSQVNEDGAGDKDNHSNARVPDGGIQLNTDTYVQQAPTPGASNVVASSPIVINEVDCDTPGTDALEFVELYDGGIGNTSLDGLVLVLFNGNGDVSYASFDLDGYTTDANGYFLIGNSGVTPAPAITFSNGTLQNGADAVAIYFGDATDFPGGTAITSAGLIDAIVYDTEDADDTGLLDVLTPGQPQVNENGAGDQVNHSNARVPNGGDQLVTTTYVQQLPTPGASNVQVATNVVINELDSDTDGSDMLEFIELFDGGTGNTALDGLVLVLFNGNGDASYAAYDLDGYSTDNDGYFVIGNSAVIPTPQLITGNGTLQNGADAAAVYEGDATDFPNGTAVTTINLIDAIVYGTDDADDTGLLVLLNSGEPQVNENSEGNKDNHSNQRFPNGDGGQRNTSTYGQYEPTPGSVNVGPPPPVFARIYEIQGTGLVSPLADGLAITIGNVVTALTYNGFFMQTQSDSTDNDPETSDGIFVYTGSAPSVAVGDVVDVTGKVIEYNGLTELTDNTLISITSSGNSLPPYVVFDENTPSPNQPQPSNEVERYEGMLVSFASGRTTGPSDQYSEVAIVAGPDRAYREPGIIYPGLSGLPVWDGNPEVFVMNPDGLGLPNLSLPAGANLSNAEGVLTYSFGNYTFLPTSIDYSDGDIETRPVRAKADDEVTIATQNMYRLFEGESNFNDRLNKFSLQVREVLGAPEILVVEEVENLSTLQALCDKISLDDPSLLYTPYLEEGNDIGGIDVGFLVRSSVVVDSVTQIGKDVTFSYDGSLLHDRPPLILEADFIMSGVPFPITVMAIHNRSLSGIETSDSLRVRLKRFTQAYWISEKIQEMQTERPGIHLVVTGDFNAYQFTDGYADVLGQFTGNLDPLGAQIPGIDIVNPDLTNQITTIPAEEQYSFNYGGSAQVLDHMLTSSGMSQFVTGIEYTRGNSDVPTSYGYDYSSALRCSDHDGLVLFVNPVDPIANTVVFATNSVWLESKANVLSGNIYVNDVSNGHELNSNVELAIHPKATTPAGFVLKANRIKLKNNSVVNGDVFYNELDNKGTINGDQVSPLELPLVNILPEFHAATPGSEDIKVGINKSEVIDEGDYGDIDVKLKGVLVFSGGTYNVKSIDVGIGAKLLFLAPTEIRVEERFDSDLLAYIGPSDDAPIDASDIIFYVSGTDKSGWLGLFVKSVQIGVSNTVYANFYAPNGTIWITLKSKFTGALWAKNVQVGINTELALDSYFNSGDVDMSGTSLAKNGRLAAAEIILPTEYKLEQNYPNPFNPTTTISFQLPETDNIRIDIFNSLGQLITTLAKGEYEAGYYQAVWDGKDSYGNMVASGMYVYRFRGTNLVKTKKMMMLK